MASRDAILVAMPPADPEDLLQEVAVRAYREVLDVR